MAKRLRPKPIAPGVTLAFRIVTPSSAENSPIDKPDESIVWIPNCPPLQATEIDIVLVASSMPVSGWPGRNAMGTKLVGTYELASGESVWVVYRVVDMPHLRSAGKGTGSYYRGRSKDDLESDDLRALIFGVESDGSWAIIDCAVEFKRS